MLNKILGKSNSYELLRTHKRFDGKNYFTATMLQGSWKSSFVFQSISMKFDDMNEFKI